MTTTTDIPIQQFPEPSVVQKTFIEATLLAGFSDETHYDMLCGEYVSTLDEIGAQSARDAAQAARHYVATLVPPTHPDFFSDIVRRPIAEDHVQQIVSDPVFRRSFAGIPHRFSYVDLTRLVALQSWVKPRRGSLPTDDAGLLAFALPTNWEVPVEINYLPQTKSIQVFSSAPALSGLQIDFDRTEGRVILSPPKHPNLVQVAIFNGRGYLRDGYHRVVDALAQGVTELPAIVTQAVRPDQVQLPAATCFNLLHVKALPRPPLVSDFLTPAATTTRVRERRYGVLIGLDVRPFNIGV